MINRRNISGIILLITAMISILCSFTNIANIAFVIISGMRQI